MQTSRYACNVCFDKILQESIVLFIQQWYNEKIDYDKEAAALHAGQRKIVGESAPCNSAASRGKGRVCMKQLKDVWYGRLRSISYYFCACLFFIGKIKFFKMVLHYAGIQSHTTAIAVGLFLVLDLLLVGYYLSVVVRGKQWKLFVLTIAVNALYLLPYLLGADWYEAAQYCVFIVPYTLCASLLVCERNAGVERFFRCFSNMSYGAALLALGYILLLFLGTPGRYGLIEIKEFSYGDIAYGLVPFVFIDLELLLRGKRIPRWIPGVRVVIMFAAIIYSGTRSAMLCMGFAMLLQVVLHWKELRQIFWRRKIIFALLLIGCVVFCMNVTPSGSRLNIMQNEVIYELQEEQTYPVFNVATGQNDTIDNVYRYYIIQNDRTRLETAQLLHEDIVSRSGAYITVAEEYQEKAENYVFTLNRVHLWRSALDEFQKSPIIGHGPLYFQNKYVKTFPHNVLFEVLTDFGVVGCGLLLAAALCGFVVVALRAFRTKNRSVQTLLAFLLIYAPAYLLYTSLYMNGLLIFAVLVIFGLLLDGAQSPLGKQAAENSAVVE